MPADVPIALGLSATPMLIQILDLLGCMAYAATGASKAIEHRFDIVGVIILSSIAGIGGALTRDVVLGLSPSSILVNPLYIGVTVSAGAAVFLLYNHLKRHHGLMSTLDAVASGVFTASGAIVALNLVGQNFLVMAFAGVIAAIGGGILRDVLVREIPAVFIRKLYFSASFVGVIVFYALSSIGVDIQVATIVTIASVVSIRLMASRYGWNMPRVKL